MKEKLAASSWHTALAMQLQQERERELEHGLKTGQLQLFQTFQYSRSYLRLQLNTLVPGGSLNPPLLPFA